MEKRYVCTDKEIKQIACEYITSNITIRELSVKYGISRSTIHRYLHKVLQEIDSDLAERTALVACQKKREGQIRGGRRRKVKRRE